MPVTKRAAARASLRELGPVQRELGPYSASSARTARARPVQRELGPYSASSARTARAQPMAPSSLRLSPRRALDPVPDGRGRALHAALEADARAAPAPPRSGRGTRGGG